MKTTSILKALSIFLLGLGATLFSACIDTLDPNQLDLDNSEPQLVIEGWVYNVKNRYSNTYINLSKTSSFVENNGPVAVPNQEIGYVRVMESGSGDTIHFAKAEGEPFLWLPEDSSFIGQVGNTYTLELEYKGNQYTATSTMFKNAELDALSTEYRGPDHPNVFDVEEDTGYYFKFNGPEPCTPGDFYRFKSFVNGKQYNRPGDLIFSDDELINGNYIGELPFPTDPYNFGDTAHFEMLRIDEAAFTFYNDAISMIFNGGLFAQPHFNVPTNINTPAGAEEAIGLFGAASIISESILFTSDIKPNYTGLVAGRNGKAWANPAIQDTTFLFLPDGTVELKAIAIFSTQCRDEVRNAPTVGTGNWSVDPQNETMTLSVPLGAGQPSINLAFEIVRLTGIAIQLRDPNNPDLPLGFLVNSGSFQQ